MKTIYSNMIQIANIILMIATLIPQKMEQIFLSKIERKNLEAIICLCVKITVIISGITPKLSNQFVIVKLKTKSIWPLK